MTTLVLFCGLPGSGKTTLARRLESERNAIRLNTDEWLAQLGLDPTDTEPHERMRQQLWVLAQGLLERGVDVVLEDGLWTRAERDARRRGATELGAVTEMHHLDVPLDELVRRLEARNSSAGAGVAIVGRPDIERFALLFERPDDDELEGLVRLLSTVPRGRCAGCPTPRRERVPSDADDRGNHRTAAYAPQSLLALRRSPFRPSQTERVRT